MKKKALFFSLPGLIILSFITSLNAQVTISFMQPPPNQWKFEDMWNVLITNATGEIQTVKLYGTLDEASQGRIAEGTSANFSLGPNYSGPLNTSWLKPVNQKYVDSKYEDIVRKTGTMPDGIYHICIYVKDTKDIVLSQDCIDQPIKNLTPPELTYPGEGTTVKEAQPVFQWMPPMPTPSGEIITYDLKIVELLDGQVAIEAMQANPSFFIQKGVRAPFFQYPLSARPFVAKKSYAWQVTAAGHNYEIGKSQVWSYVFTKDTAMITPPNCDDLCTHFQNVPLWNFKNFTISTQYSSNPWNPYLDDNNSIYLTQELQIMGRQILYLGAEIVYFRWTSDQPDCKRCTNNDYSWGNFISGTVDDADFITDGTSRADESGNVLSGSHELDWTTKNISTPADFNGKIKLRLSLPPQTELFCCNDCFRFQIRYSIIFMVNGACIFCNTTQCYQIQRKHRAFTATVANDCGDPIPWTH